MLLPVTSFSKARNDRDRCQAAGIPESIVYRPKWRIALEQYDRAVANGVRFDWLTFDEGYGSKPEFLQELTSRGHPINPHGTVPTAGLAL